MKILWVKADFLHPTDRGGQIRTLEILKRLHARHEVHYLAYRRPQHPDALGRCGEYCAKAYPVEFDVPERRSLAFAGQLLGNLFSSLPLSVARYKSDGMRDQIAEVLQRENFDSIVCDFPFPAPNFSELKGCVLFQHNVEYMIWQRHVEHAPNPLRKAYFRSQAQRMFNFERDVCRSVRHMIAVSDDDATKFRELYCVDRVSVVPTGVDIDYFAPASKPEAFADLTFVGSMDWMPNIDAMRYFLSEIFPLIRKQRPATTLGIVGRKPPAEVTSLTERDPLIKVTGTVPDVRPYLWGSTVSIVPLRIGGGTRLKIYEAVAAGLPVVSTTVGAEGLGLADQEEIAIADTPEAFARTCVSLLEDAERRSQMQDAAYRTVAGAYSWDRVTDRFEEILENARNGQVLKSCAS